MEENVDLAALRLKSVMTKLLAEIGPGVRVVVIAGAAISLAPPANLPDVWRFREALGEELARQSSATPTQRDLKKLLSDRKPPFERLMQMISDTLESSTPDFVPNMLIDLFGRGEPNQNHKVLADLLVTGQIELILTTNFDELLEKAHPGIRRVVTEHEFAQLASELALGPLKTPTVAHLHGSVTFKDSLVALMGQIGKPLSGYRRTVLDQVLQTANLILIGYSATDEDIGPVFKAYPNLKLWRLVRATQKTYEPHERPVELNPSDFQEVIQGHIKSLGNKSPADLEKIVGAVSYTVSEGLLASQLFQKGQSLDWTESAAIVHAETLASEHLYRDAISVLLKPALPTSHWYSRWIGSRAFFYRHLGQFDSARSDLEELRDFLINAFSTHQDQALIWEIIHTTLWLLESLLLGAIYKSEAERDHLLIYCERLLAECRNWSMRADRLPPIYEMDYYEAEIALARGYGEEAAQSYQHYAEKSEYWAGSGALVLVGLRQAVALKVAGNWQASWREWRKGLGMSAQSRSLVPLVQYVVILPVLLGAPVTWYWIMRSLAARLYPIYGQIKLLWMHLRKRA